MPEIMKYLSEMKWNKVMKWNGVMKSLPGIKWQKWWNTYQKWNEME